MNTILNVVDTTTQACIFQNKPQRARSKPDGRTWRDQLPLKIVGPEPLADRLMQPMGAVAPWHAMEFRSRHTELSWLIQSQHRELAPLAQEFAANGLSASSLSSSFDDDDREAAEISEHRTHRTPYDPDPIELAARQRQYEFDQYLLGCSQTTKVFLKVNAQGQRALGTNDVRLTGHDLVDYKNKLFDALGELPSAEEIQNNRARAAHYKQLVWAAMTPEEQLAWTRRDARHPVAVRYAVDKPEHTILEPYLDPGDSNVERLGWPGALDRGLFEPVADGAPQELGQHYVEDGEVLPEPNEFELWPVGGLPAVSEDE